MWCYQWCFTMPESPSCYYRVSFTSFSPRSSVFPITSITLVFPDLCMPGVLSPLLLALFLNMSRTSVGLLQVKTYLESYLGNSGRLFGQRREFRDECSGVGPRRIFTFMSSRLKVLLLRSWDMYLFRGTFLTLSNISNPLSPRWAFLALY